MGLVSLNTELRQTLKLTPQLMQSMEVLQFNSQELLEYINKVSEENPILEQEDSPALRSAYEELRQKASWIDGGVYGASFSHEETAYPERGAMDRETESLSAFLIDQLERQHLPRPLLALTRYLAELVDEDGYLSQEDLDSLADLKIPEALIAQALTTVQQLEPPGVCARDLAECLVLQLNRQPAPSPAALAIAERFLPELSKKHYHHIARELGLTVAEIQEAEQQIAALEPHPGRAYQPSEPAVYVRPDIFVLEEDGQWKVVLNEYYLPRVSISSYYARLLRESDEQETKEYLRQKMQQAKWLLNSLERRGSTLRRCAEAVLEAQLPFFTGESTALSPMNLSTLAETLELHPSTISRATRGKYLQCRQGIYPLRYFFSRSIGDQGPSQQAVKLKLLQLVKEEDPRHPLSDQKLCELLSGGGVHLARRTVAKYRLELGIGSSTARRQHTGTPGSAPHP